MTFDYNIDTIVERLGDDDDTVTINRSDGRWQFKLSVGYDDATVDFHEDPEVFGRYQYGSYRYGEGRERPAGFTGAACKLSSESDQGGFIWYEPPADFRRFKGSGFATVEEWEKAKERNLRYVRSLLSWGYNIWIVTCTHVRKDGYERSWQAALGGVETDMWTQTAEERNERTAFERSIVHDLVVEVIDDINQQEAA